MAPQLRCEDYSVGWVCALSVELAAAEELLDEEHETPEYDVRDTNIYTCGRIGHHNIVIACLPAGQIGTNSAAAVAMQMKSTFTSTRFGLLVGIGGGVPSEDADIRLGDVVVSTPNNTHGGVVQYDSGKATLTGFERVGSLDSPPTILLGAVAKVRAKHMRGKGIWLEYLSKLANLPGFGREAGSDVLFEAEYNHKGGTTCRECNHDYLLPREARRQEVVVHYGTIASGNQVIKTAVERDRLSAELGGVLCFEMEAAGLMNSFPCLVIRGICDYADSHKNKRWQMHAAGAAAAYAKEVLSVIPFDKVQAEKKIVDIFSGLQETAAKHQLIAEEHLDIARSIREQELSDRHKECLQSFRLTKSTRDVGYEWYKDRIEDRVEGTCNWFLQHDHFQEWFQQVSGPLLVTADPGCGKSVLAKYLVDHVLPESATVCYFFFKEQDQNTVRQALCALLHQLFLQKPALLEHARRQQKQDGKGLVNSIKSLWTVLENAVQDSQAGPVVIVLDALDECAESEFEDLMRTIVGHSRNSQSSRGMLRYLMTSRPYEQIIGKFRGLLESLPCMHIPGEERSESISHEINHVIRDRVGRLARDKQLSDDVRAGLLDALLKVEHRTYLWAHLVFDHLKSEGFKKTRKGVESAIKTLPKTVNQAYEKILSRSKDQPMVRKVLAIILAASRALTLSELNIAVEIEETTPSWQELDLEREEDFKSRLRSWCGLFVSVHHGKVYLLHQTAREFLLTDVLSSTTMPQELQWQHSITMHHAHQVLAEQCLRYLNFYNSEIGSTITTEAQDSRYDGTYNFLDDGTYDFLGYSGKFWPMHFREARLSTSKDAVLLQLGLKVSDPKSMCFSRWAEIQQRPHYYSPVAYAPHLTIVSWFGHDENVKMLLDMGAQVNAQGGEYGNALQAASAAGHQATVQLLLDNGADVNKEGGLYSNALYAAVDKDHLVIVELLLKNGADAARHNHLRQSVLHYATDRVTCSHSLIKLLLSHGAPANTTDTNNMTPLLYSVKRGHKSVVGLFLEMGVPIDARVYRKPWSWNTVKISKHDQLLFREPGSDVLCISAGLTPLHFAALTGNLVMTKFLLEHGADPNALSGYDESPIHLTLRKTFYGPEYNDDWTESHWRVEGVPDILDHEEVDNEAVSRDIAMHREGVLDALLADSRTSLTISDYRHEHPLHCVKYGESGSVWTVVKLVSRGADPFARNLEQQNALHLASQAGDYDAVTFLLSLGAEPALTDNDGLNALHYAARSGKHGTITALLETNAARRLILVASRDFSGRNSLHHLLSTNKPRHKTIQLLLEKGVDSSELDASGNSPLATYFQSRWLDTVDCYQQLLSIEGNSSFVNRQGQNLGHLHAMNWRCSVRVLEALKEHGVDLTRKDVQGRTILHWSAIHGSITRETLHYLVHVVRVDMDAKDSSGRTALDHAAEIGREYRDPFFHSPERRDRIIKVLSQYGVGQAASRAIEG